MLHPARLAHRARARRAGARRGGARGLGGRGAGQRRLGAGAGRDPTRLGAGRPGGPGDQRVPVAAAPQPADDGAGLRLRPDERAAERRPDGVHRVGRARGARRPRQPVPLLAAHRRQPDPLRRLRRGLPPRRAAARALRGPAGELRAPGVALLRDLPAARGPHVHAPVGRCDRHVHAVRGVLRPRPRGPGRLRRGVHRARGRARPASPRRSCSTCWRGSRPSGPRWRWCGAGRCRSRPSRSRRSAST